MSCFDAHITVDHVSPAEPRGATGAILFGADAEVHCRQLRVSAPGPWLYAASLQHIIGPDDPRFPATMPNVIDLDIPEETLLREVAGKLTAWWPLLEGIHAQRAVLRLRLPANSAGCVGVRRLAKQAPHAKFLIDPFRLGPHAGWQAQVRLAELENVFITTLGLFPGGEAQWHDRQQVAEMLYFVSGEVGAGKLLFASGMRWETVPPPESPAQWLTSTGSLDDAQRPLVLEGNARELFLY